MRDQTGAVRRTTASLFEDLEPLIAAALGRHPQWHMLIEPLRHVARALDDPSWIEAAAGAALPRDRSPEAPILDRAVIAAPPELARFVATLTDWQPSHEIAAALVEASIRNDQRAIDAIAFAADRDAGALATMAGLVAMPLLHACARTHASRVPDHWSHGYCPLCGAWPVLAELVGIDRSRRLRCGRCALGWASSVLTCAYCGEQDHRRLGRLVPEATRDTRYLETCASCGGYMKTLTTLTPCGAVELAIRDLDTVELDLAALEHGVARPLGPGYPVDVQIRAAA
jgi:FdhE protein